MVAQSQSYHKDQEGKSHGSNMGQKIKQLRAQKGLSQYRLSIMSSVPQSSISRLENGNKTGVSSRTLERIAESLNTTIDYLISDGSIQQAGTNASKWLEILRSTISLIGHKIIIVDDELTIIESSVSKYKALTPLSRYLDESSYRSLAANLQSVDRNGMMIKLGFSASERQLTCKIAAVGIGHSTDKTITTPGAYCIDLQSTSEIDTMENRVNLAKFCRELNLTSHDDLKAKQLTITAYIKKYCENMDIIAWCKKSSIGVYETTCCLKFDLDGIILPSNSAFGDVAPGVLNSDMVEKINNSNGDRVWIDQEIVAIDLSSQHAPSTHIAIMQFDDEQDAISAWSLLLEAQLFRRICLNTLMPC